MKFSKLWAGLKGLIDGVQPPEPSDMPGQPPLPYFYLGSLGTYYSPKIGNFGTQNNETWYYCRDLFHNAVDSTYDKMRYLYSLGNKMPKDTVELVTWVEEKLKLDRRTQFSILYNYKPSNRVEKQNILQVEPASFWWDKLPHSFFTCLLRASTHDTGDHPLDIMYKYQYFSGTWSYVERYLEGFTKYVGTPMPMPNSGWYYTMTHCLTAEQVLVKP